MSFLVKWVFFLEIYPKVNVDSLGQCAALWELSRQAVNLQGWLRAVEATNPALGKEAHQEVVLAHQEVVLAVILQQNQRIQVLLHLKQEKKKQLMFAVMRFVVMFFGAHRGFENAT